MIEVFTLALLVAVIICQVLLFFNAVGTPNEVIRLRDHKTVKNSDEGGKY